MTDTGEWLIDFQGRNDSGAYTQSFLWRRGSVYVMDNHRAAAWCWLQHIDPPTTHSLFHIDRHYDCLTSRIATWHSHLPASWNKMGIQDYLDFSYVMPDYPEPTRLFSWDNYLSIYLDHFGKNVKRCYFATHQDGDPPNHDRVSECQPWELPENLYFWLAKEDAPWIMNIDLDYFFWHENDEDRISGEMFSDEYIRRFCEGLRLRIEDGTIAVTTIALTPSKTFTGGWEASERILERVLSGIGIQFQLPRSTSPKSASKT